MNNASFRTNNETQFLINILNTMYNDNLRQMTALTELLNNLNNSNNQIRTLLVQAVNREHDVEQRERREIRYRQDVRQNRDIGHRQDVRQNRDIRQRQDVRQRQETGQSQVDYDSRFSNLLINEYIIPVEFERRINREINWPRIAEEFLNPVQIYPTTSQIEAATRRVHYCDITRPINTSCPISMEEFNDNDIVCVIRHCGHTFHTEHIMNWFRTSCRCPVCRYDIRDYNPVQYSHPTISEENTSNNTNNATNNNATINNTNTNTNTNTNNNANISYSLETVSLESIDNILNNFVDFSGNYSTDTANIIASLFVNALNRSQNSR
jgi:hypothetical protein